MPVSTHRSVPSLRLVPVLLVLLALAYQAIMPHGFMPTARANTLELVLAVCNPHQTASPLTVSVQQDEPASLYGASGYCPYCPLFGAIDPPTEAPAVQVAPIAEFPLPLGPRAAAPVATQPPGPPLGSRAPPPAA